MSRMPRTHRLAHRRFEREQIAKQVAERDQIWEAYKQENPDEKHLSEMEAIHKRYERRDEEIMARLDRTIERLA